MTFPALSEIVRKADRDELPAILGKIREAEIIATQRLQERAQPAPSPKLDDQPDYTPLEVAQILNLRSRKNPEEFNAAAIYDLARRADPIPVVRYGSRLRIPRKAFWGWKSRQGGQR